MLKQEQTKKLYLAFLTESCTSLRVLSIELCFSVFKMSILSVTSLTHTLTLRLLYDLKQFVALNCSPGENLLFKAFRSRLWRLFVFVFFVIASPTFSQAPPPVLEALVGSHLSLACVAHGNPSPTITWLKDGNVIERTSTRVGFYSSTLFYTFHPRIL